MFAVVRKLALVSAVVLGASFANAQEATQKMTIPQGTFEVSGGFNWIIEEGDNTFLLFPRALYFLTENLALGGGVEFEVQGDDTDFAVGPEVKYYIPVSAKTAAYIGERILWDDSDDADSDFRSTTSLGYNVFFSPTIAFGPSINYNFDLEDGADGDNNDNFQVLGVFSIYL